MTAPQLIARVKKNAPPPAVLLLGPEAYDRRRLKEALTASFPEGSVTQHDLSELTLAEVLDDARSLSPSAWLGSATILYLVRRMNSCPISVGSRRARL